MSTYSATESLHVCSSSRSGFTSAGECRALSGLARAITRVAGQSNINIAPHGRMKPAKNTGDEKARMLMEPLCHFYEDIGSGEVEQ
jgi:hypothetical protein